MLLVGSLAGLAVVPAHGDATRPMPGPFDQRAAMEAGRVAQETAAAPLTVRTAAVGGGGSHLSYRVFATQYQPNTAGSVEVAVPDKCVKFAALGWSTSGCPPGYPAGLDYRVIVTLDNGRSMTIPVKEVGPWNIDDNYWNLPTGTRPRRLFKDLPRGLPESQAAVQNGYNTVSNCKNLDGSASGHSGGADQFGRCVLNPSALDISIPAAQQLGFAGSSYVTATFLWEDSASVSKPAVFRGGSWFFRASLTTGPGDFGFTFGQPGDVPVLGDWNNDGQKTVGVFRPSNGVWYLRNSNTPGPADGVFRFGAGSDVPVVGDWNNDGTDTLGVFRPSEGRWYLSNHFGGGAEGVFQYGQPGDTPVVGDWNHDGTDTLGVFRSGRWFLSNHFGGSAEGVFQYGQAGDIPVPGDWDGDGTDTLGVFRAGTWFATNLFNSGAGQAVFNFGGRGDTPRAWR